MKRLFDENMSLGDVRKIQREVSGSRDARTWKIAGQSRDGLRVLALVQENMLNKHESIFSVRCSACRETLEVSAHAWNSGFVCSVCHPEEIRWKLPVDINDEARDVDARMPRLRAAFLALEPRLQRVISMRYNGKTLEEIAKEQSVSRERIRQLVRKAEGLLKKFVSAKRGFVFKPVIDRAAEPVIDRVVEYVFLPPLVKPREKKQKGLSGKALYEDALRRANRRDKAEQLGVIKRANRREKAENIGAIKRANRKAKPRKRDRAGDIAVVQEWLDSRNGSGA